MLQADNVSYGYGTRARAARRPAEAGRQTEPLAHPDERSDERAGRLETAPTGSVGDERQEEPRSRGGIRREPGSAVIRDISMSILEGGLVGILGPNGSGKTTLLKLLGGLLRPTSGRILIDGEDITGWSRRALARRISVVPQETHLAFDYSVLDVVLMGRYPHLGAFELEGGNDLAIAREALAATRSLALADRPFDTLSGGEKQRVVIASALAQSASTMLLDEPTAALDPGYQVEVASLLHALNRERGVTMAVATHDLNFAAGLCRELVLLRGGEVLAAGPTRDVLTTDTVRALYDLEADVRFHEGAGHLTVVPMRRSVTQTGDRS